MPYRKVIAEIIATEISSLQQTFNTYKKCVQLITEVEKTKLVQQKNIAPLLEALKKHLVVYEQMYVVVGEPIENFFANLNIPLPEQLETETNPNKLAQALANLICSEQFFEICKLREKATLEYFKFNQTFSSLTEALAKKSFNTSTYIYGDNNVNTTISAAMQRLMRYQLLGKELEEKLPTTLKTSALANLATLLLTIGNTGSSLANEKDRILDANDNSLKTSSTPRRDQIVEMLEKVTQQLNPLSQLFSQKTLTDEELKALGDFLALQKMKSHIQMTLREIDAKIVESMQQTMTKAKNTITTLSTTKTNAEKLLTSIYKTLKEPAPPFKRELSSHQPYVYIVAPEKIADNAEEPAVDQPKRSGSKSKLQRVLTNISRKFSLGSADKAEKRDSVETSSSSDEISLITPRANSSIAIPTTTISTALTASSSAPTSPTASSVRLRVEAINRGEIARSDSNASSSNAESSSAGQEQPQETRSPRPFVAEKIAEFEQRIAKQQEELLKDSQQLLKSAVALNQRLTVTLQATPSATPPAATKIAATPPQPKFGLSNDAKKRSHSLGSHLGNNKINGTATSSASASSSMATQFKP
jgi:hypothetical protein